MSMNVTQKLFQSHLIHGCHHSVRSMQVALFLEQHGFTQISNLAGSVHAWAQQVDSTMPTY